MNRRQLCLHLLGASSLLWIGKLNAHTQDVGRVRMSEEEWLDKLSPREYDILRLGDTEPAGTSPLNAEHREGVYHCAGCDLALFQSKWKYNSGTGWPSFWDVIPEHVKRREMHGLFRSAIEYHCAQCQGHQGHIFDDGPEPTGLRYCNNGIALNFKPA